MTVPAMQRRHRRPMRHDYGFSDTKKGWKGPVERRDPTHYQRPSTILSACVNVYCRLWLSPDAVRCPHCHTRQTALPSSHPPR